MQDIVRSASGPTQLGKAVYRLGIRGAILGTQGIRGAVLGTQGTRRARAALRTRGTGRARAALRTQGMCRQAASRKGRANVVASGALRRVFSS